MEEEISLEHFKSALKIVQPIMKKEGFTEKPETTLDDVGGLEFLKKELKK